MQFFFSALRFCEVRNSQWYHFFFFAFLSYLTAFDRFLEFGWSDECALRNVILLEWKLIFFLLKMCRNVRRWTFLWSDIWPEVGSFGWLIMQEYLAGLLPVFYYKFQSISKVLPIQELLKKTDITPMDRIKGYYICINAGADTHQPIYIYIYIYIYVYI